MDHPRDGLFRATAVGPVPQLTAQGRSVKDEGGAGHGDAEVGVDDARGGRRIGGGRDEKHEWSLRMSYGRVRIARHTERCPGSPGLRYCTASPPGTSPEAWMKQSRSSGERSVMCW